MIRTGKSARRRRRRKQEDEQAVPKSAPARKSARTGRAFADRKIQRLATRALQSEARDQTLTASGVTKGTQTSVRGGNLRLHGRTRARFNGGSYRTENVVVDQGEGCQGCRPRQCVHVTGTLVVDYSVTTQVTLPSLSQYPDLTPCQRARVQEAIDNVLAPHEQEHVRAFEQYNGTTRSEFEFTLCRSQFSRRIRQMVRSEAQARCDSAQSASDRLDPFFFDVDLDCVDR